MRRRGSPNVRNEKYVVIAATWQSNINLFIIAYNEDVRLHHLLVITYFEKNSDLQKTYREHNEFI